MIDLSFLKQDSVQKLIRFVLVGFLNTAFGYVIFTALVLFGLGPQVALAIAFPIGIAWNYTTHAKIVFGQGGAKKVPAYVGVYVFIYVFNAISLHYALKMGLSPFVAQAILAAAAAAMSFVLISVVLTGRIPFIELLQKGDDT